MDLLAITLLLLLIGANLLRYRDPLYPGFLQPVVWLVVALALELAAKSYGELSAATYTTFAVGALAFGAGSFVATHRLARVGVAEGTEVTVPQRWTTLTLLGAAALAFVPYWRRAVELAESSNLTDSFFLNLRISLTRFRDDFGGYGIWAYGLTVSFVAAYCAVVRLSLARRKKTDAVVAAIAVILALSYAALATGRTFVFLLFFVLCGPLLVLRRVGPLKMSLGGAAFLLAVFVVYAGVFRKGVSAESSEYLLQDSGSVIFDYVAGGSYAFDDLVSHPRELELGVNTFRTFFAVLQRIGVDIDVKGVVQEYTGYSLSTNVYTVYQPYYLDFGSAGAAVFMALLGGLHGYAYRRVSGQRKDMFFVFMFSLSLYPLFMQFFQEQYFTLASTWLQFGLIGFLALRLAGVEHVQL